MLIENIKVKSQDYPAMSVLLVRAAAPLSPGISAEMLIVEVSMHSRACCISEAPEAVRNRSLFMPLGSSRSLGGGILG